MSGFLSGWWAEFRPAVGRVEQADALALRDAVADAMAWLLFPAQQAGGADPRSCPGCGSGRLAVKFSRFGPFIGCDAYPNCSYTRTIGRDDQSERGGRLIGHDEGTGLEVSLRHGPFGPYVQLGGNLTRDQEERLPLPDVGKMKMAQLKDELANRGLSQEGRKASLVEESGPHAALLGWAGPILLFPPALSAARRGRAPR